MLPGYGVSMFIFAYSDSTMRVSFFRVRGHVMSKKHAVKVPGGLLVFVDDDQKPGETVEERDKRVVEEVSSEYQANLLAQKKIISTKALAILDIVASKVDAAVLGNLKHVDDLFKNSEVIENILAGTILLLLDHALCDLVEPTMDNPFDYVARRMALINMINIDAEVEQLIHEYIFVNKNKFEKIMCGGNRAKE